MGKIYDYKTIGNLADLKEKQKELQTDGQRHEMAIKDGVTAYIHQFTPAALINKATRKPREKVASIFGKVKSWFSRKKKD